MLTLKFWNNGFIFYLQSSFLILLLSTQILQFSFKLTLNKFNLGFILSLNVSYLFLLFVFSFIDLPLSLLLGFLELVSMLIEHFRYFCIVVYFQVVYICRVSVGKIADILIYCFYLLLVLTIQLTNLLFMLILHKFKSLSLFCFQILDFLLILVVNFLYNIGMLDTNLFHFILDVFFLGWLQLLLQLHKSIPVIHLQLVNLRSELVFSFFVFFTIFLFQIIYFLVFLIEFRIKINFALF